MNGKNDQMNEVSVDDLMKSVNEELKIEKSPSDVMTRYKHAEDTFYDQLQTSQDRLTEMLDLGKASEIRALTAVSKDLLNNYSESVRLRKLAEIESGKYVPITVIEQYQRDVFPSISSGIDNLRVDILNQLKPQERASFDAAWNDSYKKFINCIAEAASRLNDYVEKARNEAVGHATKERFVNSEKRTQAQIQQHALRRNSNTDGRRSKYCPY